TFVVISHAECCANQNGIALVRDCSAGFRRQAPVAIQPPQEGMSVEQDAHSCPRPPDTEPYDIKRLALRAVVAAADEVDVMRGVGLVELLKHGLWFRRA